MTPLAALRRGLTESGQPLAEAAQDKLIAYLELLAKWNRTYNLTAIRDPLLMISHHLLDSLAVRPHLPEGALADVGSGGGLPGIPLAIAEPQRRVTLNDANHKKAAFLQQAVIELKLANADVHTGRVQAWRPSSPFACVIARGFAELAQFVASCRHLVREGGVLAAMKGVYPRDELNRVPLGADCSEVRRLEVPLLAAERHLVLCRCTP
ncbi:MAG: 16S rRNA (guanine(527)-N(7))-methyltransferase RsmG [Burkholderiales bacterium]